MAKLNQIVAVVNGQKNKSAKVVGELYKHVQKTDLFNGFVKHYHPKDEEGEHLESEKVNVRLTTEDVVNTVKETLAEVWDAVATQDVGNTYAKADIVVDDKVVLQDVPVTYLMYLEKQLVDLHTFVSKLPILDDAYEWTWDSNANLFKTGQQKTSRTKKVAKPIVLYEATEHHPAQVQLLNEDVTVGEWETTKTSGAIPAKKKQEMVKQVEKLQKAVKYAREQANGTIVDNIEYAEKVFDFVFGD